MLMRIVRWVVKPILGVLIAVLAAVLMLLMACGLALAAGQSANVSWTIPTTYTDGTSMPVSALQGYIVFWQSASAGAPSGEQMVAGGATNAVVIHINCGIVNFTLVSVTTTGAMSAPSNVVNYNTGLQCVNGVSGFKVGN
ncbi:MAG: hypothetical protein KGL39_09530 [Patescibacteria group bacterium]|nr:hypothetical protein [Patescibacteria group bacterium]